MVLLSPVHKGLTMTHERIALFGSKERSPGDLQQKTIEGKRQYLHKQLLQVFQFSEANLKVQQLQQHFQQFSDMFNAGAAVWLNEFEAMVKELHEFTLPLLEKLNSLLVPAEDYETDPALQSFFKEYVPVVFSRVQEKIWVHWRKMPGLQAGHSRKSADAFFTEAEALNEWWKERILKLTRLKDGFNVGHFFGRRSTVALQHGAPHFGAAEKPAKAFQPKNDYATGPERDDEIPHIELYRLLRKLTSAIVEREQVPSYMVATAEMLRELCKWLPQTPADLQLIKGFGPKKVEWIGDEFLGEIVAYCEANGLESNMQGYGESVKKPRREKQEEKPRVTKSSSVEATLALWKELKSIEAVAAARNLSPNTISGHLAMAMEEGGLEVHDFINEEKRVAIEQLLPDELSGVFMAPIKEQLGETFGYNDIKFAIAYKRWQKKQPAGG
jgi:hypothetical protein